MNNSGLVPDMGQRVYTIGCPLGNRGTVSSGYVDGPPGVVDGQALLQVRMEVEPGSSGSPVFDRDGNLVAVVKGRLKGGNASGLLIPMDTIISFVREK
jgi:serine protease Do